MPPRKSAQKPSATPVPAPSLPSLAVLIAALRLYPSALQLKGAHSKSSPLRLSQLDSSLGARFSSPEVDANVIEKEALVEVLDWKLARGKFRPTLPKLVASNEPEKVKKCLHDARDKLQKCKSWEDALKSGAVEKLIELKGIGPATASAYLSFLAPSLFPFFSDEAASFFPSLLPLKYTLSEYKAFVPLMAAALSDVNASLRKDGLDEWGFGELEKAMYAIVVLRKEGQADLLQSGDEKQAVVEAHSDKEKKTETEPVDGPAKKKRRR